MRSLNKVLESLGWKPDEYQRVPEEKAYYVKRFDELGRALGENWSPLAIEAKWQGWILRRI